MRTKLILPALTEATSPYFRPIKYSLFPPLGLASLAGYLRPTDQAEITDEHVEKVNLNDDPEIVAIEVYITSARRAYAIADHYRRKGAHVCLGGPHVTAVPGEASHHADTIFIGPGEDTWPAFLADFQQGKPADRYTSRQRSLLHAPYPRRDLIKRNLYLVPNSIVVSRGCPHHCDFCYKDVFYAGGASYYTQTVDRALDEIASLKGRHLFFLDDHLFGNQRFAEALFTGMKGMGRIWQAAGTIQSILQPGLMEKAAACGLRSLFVGFETLSQSNLAEQHKTQNLDRDYNTAIQRLHDLGIMVNASFVFGMDGDDRDVFARTVEWAINQGVETATFHILTPYPGTPLFSRMQAQNRLLSQDWDLYDTRHAVFQPAGMTPSELEEGYWRAYRDFYSWGSILNSARNHDELAAQVRHLAYTVGWKKFEFLWNWIIRSQLLRHTRGFLEKVLAGHHWEDPIGAPETTQLEHVEI